MHPFCIKVVLKQHRFLELGFKSKESSALILFSRKIGQARRELRQKDTEWTQEKNKMMLEKIGRDSDGSVSEEAFVTYFLSGGGALSRDTREFETMCEAFKEAAEYLRKKKPNTLHTVTSKSWLEQPITIKHMLFTIIFFSMIFWAHRLGSRCLV